MKLSENEQKMVSLLRKQHEGWKTTKIIILSGSIVFFLVALYGLISGGEILLNSLVFGLSAGGFSYAIAGWFGRPEVSLLLKLIENHEKKDI